MSANMSTVELPPGIRVATVDDAPDILRLIRELAIYEREPDSVANTQDLVERWLFGDDAVASALVAELDPATGSGGTGKVVGVAVWYRSYSTWTGVPGVYLEDLFVEPEHRGHGFGKAFLVALARIALDRGYQRLRVGGPRLEHAGDRVRRRPRRAADAGMEDLPRRGRPAGRAGRALTRQCRWSAREPSGPKSCSVQVRRSSSLSWSEGWNPRRR